eukprot:1158190-Alexandrium_andersonii.AAC.1
MEESWRLYETSHEGGKLDNSTPNATLATMSSPGVTKNADGALALPDEEEEEERDEESEEDDNEQKSKPEQ